MKRMGLTFYILTSFALIMLKRICLGRRGGLCSIRYGLYSVVLEGDSFICMVSFDYMENTQWYWLIQDNTKVAIDFWSKIKASIKCTASRDEKQ